MCKGFIEVLQLNSDHLVMPWFTGKLKEWSLVLYGTSEQPYSPTNEFPKVERFRYSRVEDPTEDYGAEDYAGEWGCSGVHLHFSECSTPSPIMWDNT